MVNKFWKKWVEANELEKEQLVKTLPIFADDKVRCPFFSASVINSYFEDLYLYAKGEK